MWVYVIELGSAKQHLSLSLSLPKFTDMGVAEILNLLTLSFVAIVQQMHDEP